ncbi:redoxin domain-containing protein [Shewanella sp. JBTF-M18]|uniref:thioredoxin-dependent peroxiredoxin n=1 Tax=Shewanella insulae TaxID=2681496 RepID=A0A6L7HUU8_9GAMM|nr:peroxiredoxin-like family protein [Shewanella insulae]MXR67943.1 redoxin domain-containing protein [Shewanella insulae]
MTKTPYSRAGALLSVLLFTLASLTLIVTPASAKPIAESPTSISPLLNGQEVPSIQVKDLQGKAVDLQQMLQGKPSVLFFYRGGWCPFCNAQMGQLQAIEKDLLKMGFQLIGISPDAPQELRASMTKNDLNYTLVSDVNLNAMRAFGLAYFTSQSISDRYMAKMKLKNKLWKNAAGDERLVLPVPAVYITDKTGLVHFQYINPNYKVRAEPKLILTAASLINS